jgi:hypothetical protein
MIFRGGIASTMAWPAGPEWYGAAIDKLDLRLACVPNGI